MCGSAIDVTLQVGDQASVALTLSKNVATIRCQGNLFNALNHDVFNTALTQRQEIWRSALGERDESGFLVFDPHHDLAARGLPCPTS
jgi:hypothetical protein